MFTFQTAQSQEKQAQKVIVLNEPGAIDAPYTAKFMAIACKDGQNQLFDVLLINSGRPYGDRLRRLISITAPGWEVVEWWDTGEEF